MTAAHPVERVLIAIAWSVVTIAASVCLRAAAMQTDHDLTWVAPPAAGTRINPLGNRPDAAAGGRKLFKQRCTTCHGDDGGGTSKAPDLTQPDVQAQSDGALFWKIATGNTHAGMPAFSFLPELQRWQLLLHLRELAVRPLGSH
jgi:mono/diheme cytochrome c family protein